MEPLGQRGRLVVLFVYVALLLVASKLALGGWLPPSSEKGLWFYAGLAALLLGNLIITPFFTRPADSISYAVSGLVAMLAANIVDDGTRQGFERILWLVVTTYITLVLTISIFAIVFRASSRRLVSLLASEAFRLSDVVGDPRGIYSAVFFFSIIVFHRNSTAEFAILLVTGLIVVAVRPLEVSASLALRMLRAVRGLGDSTVIGELIARQEPGVMLVRQNAGVSPSPGDLAAVRAADGETHVGLILDRFFLAGETWLRLGQVGSTELSEEERQALARESTFLGSVSLLRGDLSQEILSKLHRQPLVSARDHIVGLVAPDTDSNNLLVEVTRTDSALEEGRLLRTRIGTREVLYQVIAGVSREEVLQQLNRYGYARAKARKIGAWNSEKKVFEPVRWLPLVNEPVFLLDDESGSTDWSSIGNFPGTAYTVSVDPQKLVTHNTAILGILGVGKTYLALELIQRMQIDQIKVICLDITDEYGRELGYVEPPGLTAMAAKVGLGKTNYQQNREEGGGVREFRKSMRAVIESFLNPTSAPTLLIIDPATFDIWQQTGNMFQGSAAMASLSPTEITRMVAELSLECVQAQGKSEQARACLVFEEAHSLVPEWNSAAAEGDQRAANGTAKAILQGRKYGLGCVLITQRTANVTKTILNQCNTIFAMRVYDSTGLEYLRNYIGEDFTNVLSTLPDRHAVVFGKASSCADPVVVSLNDRAQFLNNLGETASKTA